MASFTRWILGPIDERSACEIAADARDEVEVHLAYLREELAREGVPEAEIEAQAMARFGDADAYVRRCSEVTLKERLMVQRLTLLVVFIMAVGMVGLAISSQRSQAKTAEALQQLANRLSTEDQRPSGGRSEPMQTVAIVGKVSHPGTYAMADGLSVRRLAAAAGVDLQLVGRVRISRSGPSGSAVVQELKGADLALDGPDVSLSNGDIITID
jgi:hypothetical protein